MVSVEKWKEHFRRLTNKLHSPDDVYLVNQRGRGIGRNAYPRRVLYKVRSQTGSGRVEGGSKVEIVSPVAQNINQARALIKESSNGIKKGGGGKRTITRKKQRSGNTSQKKKKNKKGPTKKKKKAPTKKKKKQKKKNKKH